MPLSLCVAPWWYTVSTEMPPWTVEAHCKFRRPSHAKGELAAEAYQQACWGEAPLMKTAMRQEPMSSLQNAEPPLPTRSRLWEGPLLDYAAVVIFAFKTVTRRVPRSRPRRP